MTATASTSGLDISSASSAKASGTPKAAAVARAVLSRVVDTAVTWNSSSAASAGRWAAVPQPRSGLAPMTPTRIGRWSADSILLTARILERPD